MAYDFGKTEAELRACHCAREGRIPLRVVVRSDACRGSLELTGFTREELD